MGPKVGKQGFRVYLLWTIWSFRVLLLLDMDATWGILWELLKTTPQDSSMGTLTSYVHMSYAVAPFLTCGLLSAPSIPMNAPNSTHLRLLETLGNAAISTLWRLWGFSRLGTPGGWYVSRLPHTTAIHNRDYRRPFSLPAPLSNFAWPLLQLCKSPNPCNHQRACQKQAIRPRQSWAQLQARSTERRGSGFLVVKPSKIVFLIYNTIPQKEDRILLYNVYHSIPK